MGDAKKDTVLALPWHEASAIPAEGVALVFFDGLNMYVGLWSNRMGEAGKGGFCSVTRTVKRKKLVTVVSLVENVKSWMYIPDQRMESR